MYDQRDNRVYGGNGNNRGGKPYGNRNYNDTPAAPIVAKPLPEDCIDQAEKLMQRFNRDITTSKIRRLYSLVTDVYNTERLRTGETLSEDSISAVGLMRVRIAYECGRDEKVKSFVQNTHILEYLKGLGNKRENFIHFTQYMEALVAYHKFFGGREN